MTKINFCHLLKTSYDSYRSIIIAHHLLFVMDIIHEAEDY